MSSLKQSPHPPAESHASEAFAPKSASPITVPWYRRNGTVTGMVAASVLAWPLLSRAIPLIILAVLLIVLTGPVYSRKKSGELRPWETSTRVLVAVFAAIVTVVWFGKEFIGYFRIGF